MKPIKKYFGTDGIRGRVGDAVINPEFMVKLGWAAGKILGTQPGSTILIGKDTRISGYLLESALQAGLSAAGVNVGLLGPMPTPAIAYLTRNLTAQAGIVISASHNAYQDNGIKIFDGHGFKLADAIECAIETELQQPLKTVAPSQLGKAKRINDAADRYVACCKKILPGTEPLNRLNIAIDCAHGANYHIAPQLFRALGATVIELGTKPNGLNINQHCGSTQPEQLQHTVVAKQADLGIAFDGDGDRVLMVDHNGAIVDGDEILYIIAKHLHRQQQLTGGVVGTLMSNYGLEAALNELGIPFVRAAVGDRHVVEQLKAKQWQLGGETSGHIVHLGHTTTGDGIMIALQVLAVLLASGESLQTLKAGMTKMPQTLLNIRSNGTVDLNQQPTIVTAVNDANKQLHGKGRVLLRPSGTEPLIRIMVEGEDHVQNDQIAQQLAAVVAQAAD